LTVQLDGERASNQKYADEFKRTVMFLSGNVSNNDQRPHMIDGWIAAETGDGL